MNDEAKDAARFRFLMEHKVRMAEARREGPEHPELHMHADLFNEKKHLSPRQRIEDAIDAERKRTLRVPK